MDKNKRKNKTEQRRKQESTLFPFFFLPFSLFICLILFSCDTQSSSQPSNYKSFEYKLRGTWETQKSSTSSETSGTSSEKSGTYSGTLVIDSDSIIITGYGKSQTPTEGGDDTKRPFRDVLNNGSSMRGYSEGGKIFIEYPDSVLHDFPYTYFESKDYPPIKTLEFNFGGEAERLDKTKEYLTGD